MALRGWALLDADIMVAAQAVFDEMIRQDRMMATAESCTGGLIAAALTSIPGSSAILDRGFVTYSNQAKAEMLSVPAALLEEFGAVSEPVARAMAVGAVANSAASYAIAVTGIAGPGGGTPDKPVGTVHFAAAGPGQTVLHQRHVFAGDRDQVRSRSVITALELLLELCRAAPPPTP
jgi:nicotinamide-nucleotide amidase